MLDTLATPPRPRRRRFIRVDSAPVTDNSKSLGDLLRNVRNHLDTDPAAKITVVTHAEGIDMLMEGAKAANGTEFAPLVSALKSRGVNFEICEITLRNRGLKKDQFIQEAEFTPSGVARIAKLQGQGHAYIKP